MLSKIKKRVFGNAYDLINENWYVLSLARAFSKLLKSQKKKNSLITAYTDVRLYHLTEALSDFGFIWKDSLRTFFGGYPEDTLHPFNPLEDLKKFEFDVILGPSHLDLLFFAKKVAQTFKEIKLVNFQTCLNLHKIFIIAALVCLIPDNSKILEVGSYQGGTTIFMAQLCKVLNKNVQIFACDTYEGIPAATSQDRTDPVFYDAGMFSDNPIERVRKRIRKQKLEKVINLVKGDVVSTLSQLVLKDTSLVFLDTDQYRGTKAGLELAIKLESRPHIFIDDTGLSSVNLAICEVLEKNTIYFRENLLTNFDYLVPKENT